MLNLNVCLWWSAELKLLTDRLGKAFWLELKSFGKKVRHMRVHGACLAQNR